MDGHLFEQVQECGEVVAVVQDRLLHRLADSFACSEVDDSFYAWIIGEKLVEGLDVGAVSLHELGTYSCDTLDTVENLFVRIGKVIDDNHWIAGFLKLDNCVRAYVASAAGNENSGFHNCVVFVIPDSKSFSLIRLRKV